LYVKMSGMELSALIEHLQQQNIVISVANGDLKLQAPRGALRPELQAHIRTHKAALLHYYRPLSMRFSLFFFGVEAGHQAHETYDLLLQAARFADTHGFTGIWLPERHFHPLGAPFPNPALLAAAVATHTHRLQLRAGSVVLPLQDPLRVAEEWAVVDQLSKGRVALSFASGWHARDFALAQSPQQDYGRRHELTLERARTVQALWRGETLWRTDGNGQACEVAAYPRPYQPELPVWLTALGNPEAYTRIGEAGHGLLTALLDQDIQELKAKLVGYREAWSCANASPEVAVFMHTFLGADTEAVRALVKTPFQNYLKQTLHLLSHLSRSAGLAFDPAAFSADDEAALLDFAFARYFDERALMGDLTRATQRVRQLMDAGVQEIACLIDFGLPADTVMEGLHTLAELVKRATPQEPC
jgi:natural product biosynthesis luciferase-like monooxygenase protein